MKSVIIQLVNKYDPSGVVGGLVILIGGYTLFVTAIGLIGYFLSEAL